MVLIDVRSHSVPPCRVEEMSHLYASPTLADGRATCLAGVGGGRFQPHRHPAPNPGSALGDRDREASVAGEDHPAVVLCSTV